MAKANAREPYELGCKLFYAAHWFALKEADLVRLLANPAQGLSELLALVDTLAAANPDECNAPIETWCSNPQAALAQRTPADAIKAGDLTLVRKVVERLGKLPL